MVQTCKITRKTIHYISCNFTGKGFFYFMVYLCNSSFTKMSLFYSDMTLWASHTYCLNIHKVDLKKSYSVQTPSVSTCRLLRDFRWLWRSAGSDITRMWGLNWAVRYAVSTLSLDKAAYRNGIISIYNAKIMQF